MGATRLDITNLSVHRNDHEALKKIINRFLLPTLELLPFEKMNGLRSTNLKMSCHQNYSVAMNVYEDFNEFLNVPGSAMTQAYPITG